MVKVEVQINYNEMNRLLTNAITDANRELAPILESYAKKIHNYQNRTGELTESTIATSIKNYLTLEAKADYARYIHDGTRFIASDPWIENTFKDNEKLIMETYDRHIAKALEVINR